MPGHDQRITQAGAGFGPAGRFDVACGKRWTLTRSMERNDWSSMTSTVARGELRSPAKMESIWATCHPTSIRFLPRPRWGRPIQSLHGPSRREFSSHLTTTYCRNDHESDESNEHSTPLRRGSTPIPFRVRDHGRTGAAMTKQTSCGRTTTKPFDCGHCHSRTWHSFRAGRIVQRTLVDVQCITRNWRPITGPSLAINPLGWPISAWCTRAPRPPPAGNRHEPFETP